MVGTLAPVAGATTSRLGVIESLMLRTGTNNLYKSGVRSSSPGGVSSIPNLGLWLDASDSSTITKAYQNIAATGAGVISTKVITASASVANLVQAGEKIRIGGTDIYTVSSVSTVTINTVETLTANYSALSVLALDKVSQWNDKSGLSNNITQGTTLKQFIYTPAKQNSKATLTCDGASAMTMPAGLLTIPAGNNTIFTVSNRTLADASIRRVLTIGASGSTRTEVGYTATVNTIDYQSRNASGSMVTATGFTETNFIITSAFRSGTTQSIQVNNGAATTDANGANATGVTEGALGAASQGTTSFLVGNIAEIIIYNRALSASEIAQVQAYLNNKWGVF